MTLRSAQFDDIYFSEEDGLAETRHVFLDGNGLPQAWQGRERFTIAETGFGTGLNFLAAWDAFRRTATNGQRLHYISFEKYPLTVEQIENALSPLPTSPLKAGGGEGRVEEELSTFLKHYPLRTAGFHRIVLAENVTLTLIFDDVNDAIPHVIVPEGVNAWFLDGFAPAKNPQMWTEILFQNMARLSADNATFATFTAAGIVKRGLQDAGFAVEKRKGFGRKRDMLAGKFDGNARACHAIVSAKAEEGKKIAIIGGGLAGTSCAYMLKQKGFHPVIFEQADHLASGASGNVRGIINPRLSAHRTAESDFYAAGFALAARTFKDYPDIEYERCGALHLLTDDDKRRKYEGAAQNWGWAEEHLLLVAATEASDIAGVPVAHEALYLPDAGFVSPQKLCGVYADKSDVRLNQDIQAIEKTPSGWRVGGENFDAVILACGAAVTRFTDLPVHTVRGQVSIVEQTQTSQNLRGILCYGGYIAPARNGRHVLGATFQKWLSHTDVVAEDHAYNLKTLKESVPSLSFEENQITGGRAALRTAAKDRFPIIGKIAESDGLYVSTAHGSHGIISTLAGATLLADMIASDPYSLPRSVIGRLSPRCGKEKTAR